MGLGTVDDWHWVAKTISSQVKRATAARITTPKDEMALLAASKDKMSVSLSRGHKDNGRGCGTGVAC
ncbi:hypothetical protein CABS01_13498 [Colletotrichum abscissum]|uniref:uncharacterized protein n=1 Tax=Colletotrichum abscissum TaxID=1671311 RepID=UPI0027D5064E|nr:uncharacterized protein CABS01_13498 [Colletotrichum abscissum]KAK1485804.1 hypothetical protein CABS01_13498 [Colletotrichum abscissum]